MNKIIVSIVLAVMLVLGINKITDVIFYVEKPEKSAYQVADVTTVASTASDEESSANSESGNIMALFASTMLPKVQKFSKNAQLVTALLKVVLIKLGQHCGGCWENRLVLFQVTNIQKQWQHIIKIGHSMK